MDLEAIRDQFIIDSGRADLETGAGEDAGANRFILDGIQFLNKRAEINQNSIIYDIAITAGQWDHDGQYIDKVLDRIRLLNSNNELSTLFPISEMRSLELYPTQGSATQGTPKWYVISHTQSNAPSAKRIKTFPPADGSYTLKIPCKFRPGDLATNGSSNFWTTYHHNLVILAALYKLEVFYRNKQGASDWLAAMDEELKYMFANDFNEEFNNFSHHVLDDADVDDWPNYTEDV